LPFININIKINRFVCFHRVVVLCVGRECRDRSQVPEEWE